MLAKGYLGTVTAAWVVALGLSSLVMLSTTPLGIGPVGVTMWFIVLAAGLVALSCAITYGIGYLVNPEMPVQRQVSHSLRRGAMLGGFISVVVALSSLQQLNLRDALLLLLALVLIEIYATARR